jgi:hypothetical protein
MMQMKELTRIANQACSREENDEHLDGMNRITSFTSSMKLKQDALQGPFAVKYKHTTRFTSVHQRKSRAV